jgi:hypothetical protein
VVSLLLIAAWLVLTFITPAGFGAVHLLLATGATMLVVWWGEAG